MFRLRLQAKKCLSCGICQDVCRPLAIGMRTDTGRSVEGSFLSYLLLDSRANRERPPSPMATFPYLAEPDACDGCRECVVQCPVGALELFESRQRAGHPPRQILT